MNVKVTHSASQQQVYVTITDEIEEGVEIERTYTVEREKLKTGRTMWTCGKARAASVQLSWCVAQIVSRFERWEKQQ